MQEMQTGYLQLREPPYNDEATRANTQGKDANNLVFGSTIQQMNPSCYVRKIKLSIWVRYFYLDSVTYNQRHT